MIRIFFAGLVGFFAFIFGLSALLFWSFLMSFFTSSLYQTDLGDDVYVIFRENLADHVIKSEVSFVENLSSKEVELIIDEVFPRDELKLFLFEVIGLHSNEGHQSEDEMIFDKFQNDFALSFADYYVAKIPECGDSEKGFLNCKVSGEEQVLKDLVAERLNKRILAKINSGAQLEVENEADFLGDLFDPEVRSWVLTVLIGFVSLFLVLFVLILLPSYLRIFTGLGILALVSGLMIYVFAFGFEKLIGEFLMLNLTTDAVEFLRVLEVYLQYGFLQLRYFALGIAAIGCLFFALAFFVRNIESAGKNLNK